MHQSENLLAQYGVDSYTRVKRAIADLRAGRGVMVVDDENRENEGDLILSTDFLTVEQMALMIRACSGIVCVCLRDEDCKRLELPQMVENNTNTQGTAFCVSIEAAHGCTSVPRIASPRLKRPPIPMGNPKISCARGMFIRFVHVPTACLSVVVIRKQRLISCALPDLIRPVSFAN